MRDVNHIICLLWCIKFSSFSFFFCFVKPLFTESHGIPDYSGKVYEEKVLSIQVLCDFFCLFFCFQLNLIYRRFVYLFCSRERDRNRKPLIIYRFKLLFLSVFVCLFLSLFVCSWSECFVKYRTQQQQKKKSKLKNILEIEGRERERKKGVKMHRINFFGIYNNNTLFANRQSGYSTTTTTKVRLWCKVFLFISISTSMNSKEPKKNWIRFEYWYNFECIEHTYCVILITF